MQTEPNRVNLELWDELADIHWRLDAYAAGFKTRPTGTLRRLELDAAGEVRGRRLLHLQCHFGLDTLSWAMLGADALGVDYSSRAIELACELSHRSGIGAEFLHANVCDLPSCLHGYDLAVATYGIIEWLDNLQSWANGIARSLAPGGRLVVVDTHPLSGALIELDRVPSTLALDDFFFRGPGPLRLETRGSYADRRAIPRTRFRYQWPHTLGDVFGALARSGLTVLELDEYEFSHYKKFDCMEQREPGRWYLPRGYPKAPLLFKILAQKRC
jgi:SAM-dependent methyltransferase